MNINSTMAELDEHVEDTNVYTVCVMDNHNNLLSELLVDNY